MIGFSAVVRERTVVDAAESSVDAAVLQGWVNYGRNDDRRLRCENSQEMRLKKELAKIHGLERSASMEFIQKVNGIGLKDEKRRIQKERDGRVEQTIRRVRRIKHRRAVDKQRAYLDKVFREDEKRINVAKKKKETKHLFKMQALNNGFDLDNFSYQRNAQLTRSLSVTSLHG